MLGADRKKGPIFQVERLFYLLLLLFYKYGSFTYSRYPITISSSIK